MPVSAQMTNTNQCIFGHVYVQIYLMRIFEQCRLQCLSIFQQANFKMNVTFTINCYIFILFVVTLRILCIVFCAPTGILLNSKLLRTFHKNNTNK